MEEGRSSFKKQVNGNLSISPLCLNDNLPTDMKFSLLIDLYYCQYITRLYDFKKPQQPVVGDGKNLRAVSRSPQRSRCTGVVDQYLFYFVLYSALILFSTKSLSHQLQEPLKMQNHSLLLLHYPETCRLWLCSSHKCRYYLTFHFSFLFQPEQVMQQVKL